MRREKSFWLTIGGLLIGFGVLGWVLPFSSDDLMWASGEGLRLLHTLFYNYNGRLLSNLLVIAGARYTILRVLFYALGSTELVYLIARVASSGKAVGPVSLMATTGLLMTMSTEVFGQTFGWFSGYINYVLGMLPILYMLLWMRRDPSRSMAWWQCLGLGLLGICAALIVEHITLYALLLGLIGSVYLFKRHASGKWGMLSFFIGSVIGAVRMFSDPSYLAIFAGTNRYRQLSLGRRLINQVIKTYTERMYRYLFHQNVLIIALLAIGLTWLIWRTQLPHRMLRLLASVCLLGYSFLTVFSGTMFNWSNLNPNGIFQKLLAVSTLVFLFGVVLATGIFIENQGLKRRMWLYMASALMLTAPFAVITPYGSRCALGTICFIIIAALDVAQAAIGERRLTHPAIVYNTILFGGLTFVLMIGLMSVNGYYNRKRTGQLQAQAQAGSTQLTLQQLPFAQFTWNTSPTTDWGWGYPLMLKNAGLSSKQYRMTFVPFDHWK